jgi:hypothetical protein
VPADRRRVQARAQGLRAAAGPIIGGVEGLRLLIIVALVAIVASLGTALFHLASGRGDSGRMVRALAVRVALSIALFILLLIAWRSGLIAPHGLQR